MVVLILLMFDVVDSDVVVVAVIAAADVVEELQRFVQRLSVGNGECGCGLGPGAELLACRWKLNSNISHSKQKIGLGSFISKLNSDNHMLHSDNDKFKEA
jgi:hypothetical protein